MVDLRPVRPRTGQLGQLTGLFAGAAAMNATMAVTSAIATIVVGNSIGSAWGAVPNSVSVVGTGVGAVLLTMIMRRYGRRPGLRFGYLLAVAGATLAVLPLLAGWPVVLPMIVAMALIGIGNASAQLSRYAAGEVAEEGRRGSALGLLVWAGAIGAVAGPLLIGPTGTLAAWLGAPQIAGPFLLGLLTAVLAAAALSIMKPAVGPRTATAAPMSPRILLGTRYARAPIAVMIIAQSVMVLIMTAVPPAMHHHGHGLGLIGAMLSVHTLGMFALSPLSGRLADLIGGRSVMIIGLLVMIGSIVPAVLTVRFGLVMSVAVFLLGYGWNLCFVGGSAALVGGLPLDVRLGLEGAADAIIWGFAAVAALLSTIVLAATDFRVLAVIAGGFIPVGASLMIISWRSEAIKKRSARYPGA